MRKIYFILLAALGMTFTSCLMEEKDLFDKTPAERMDAYLSEYRTLLSSSEGGWLLNYYPEEEQSYGGYAYVLKFTGNDVTAWFQLDEDIQTPVTSLYKMTADDGPVITFDTYNENIHFFATPDIVNYQAYQGDYEFRIVGKSDDGSVIYMKGKKTNNSYNLVKFSGDPVEYLDKVNAINEAMTCPAYSLSLNGTPCQCSLSGNILTFSYTVGEGETAEVVEGSSAFCYTADGISLYEPVEIGGVAYSSFKFNAENDTLSSDDGKIVISLVLPPLNEILTDNAWFIRFENLTGSIKSAFSNAESYVKSYYGMAFQYMILGSYIWGDYALEHIIGGYYGSCGLDFELIDEDKVKFTYNTKNQSNGTTFYNGGLVLAVNALCGKTFVVSTDKPKDPSYLTLTDEANPDNTLTVFPPEVAYK